MAMNGRMGRRVACVLDNRGLGFEILDMEGEGEAEEEETTTTED
jgi:anaphase-promoting complex subunit 4